MSKRTILLCSALAAVLVSQAVTFETGNSSVQDPCKWSVHFAGAGHKCPI